MTDDTGADDDAPGRPGIPPTWTSSAKDMVGCSLGRSRIWFTLGFGIVNEVYYPSVDCPQIRDLGFIVGDGAGFWVEVKQLQNYTIRLMAPGTPAVEIVHRHARFTLTLRVTPDLDRDVLLIAADLAGDPELQPYVLLAPRLGMTGRDNSAAVTSQGGRRILSAAQGQFALALAAVDGAQIDAFGRASAGYVGESDGWQDFHRNGALTWQYPAAGPGNVALIGQLQRKTVLALGFAGTVQAAATLAVSGLMQPFGAPLKRQIEAWQAWHVRRDEKALILPGHASTFAEPLVLSAMTLRVHRDKTFSGSMVASLSVPWGNSRDNRGGYHLVWPRDLVQCATALLALGAEHEARETLSYLIATQKQDGSWNQNQWLDGSPYWEGVQLDETAFPVLLAAALAERDGLEGIAVTEMVRKALGFIVATGPASPQDRWEENAGISVFTLSICIAALVAGARFLDGTDGNLARLFADFWNANVERWTSIAGTPMGRRLGVDSYFIRVAPADVLSNPSALRQNLDLRNAEPGRTIPAEEEVSVDFLQLVRLGLRQADDPVVCASLAVADSLLKADTPNGPAWRRYVGDGYGEHDDGSPYDGTGTGRAWPLLAGERGHYEVAAGRDPIPFLKAMAAMTGPGGMMPEQVWDAAAIPSRWLFPGKPTGSAMPLAWTHAEFVKLVVSRHLGWPVDRPAAVWERHGGRRPAAKVAVWCLHARIGHIARDADLLMALPQAATVRWSADGWDTLVDAKTQPDGLGMHAVTVAATALGNAGQIDFAIQWQDGGIWAGDNFRIGRQD